MGHAMTIEMKADLMNDLHEAYQERESARIEVRKAREALAEAKAVLRDASDVEAAASAKVETILHEHLTGESSLPLLRPRKP